MRFIDFLKRPTTGVAAIAFAGTTLLSGCQGLIDQLQSDTMAVAVLTQTPPVDDPAHPGQQLPEAAAFTLSFGSVDKSKITSGSASAGAVTPIKGADVMLSFTDPDTKEQVGLILTADSSGNYTATSQDSKLKVKNTLYTLEISYAGKNYKMTVTPPQATRIKEFEASKLIANYTPGTDFTITRQPATTDVAIVNVVARAGDSATDAYTNLPKDPLSLLKFALADGDWRKASFTVPGSTFQAQNQYVVTLSTMAKGEQSNDTGVDKLFVGEFLAGFSDAGVIATK